jgi:hypothetical protein
MPHSVGDSVDISIDGEFLCFQGMGMNHQHQTILPRDLADFG